MEGDQIILVIAVVVGVTLVLSLWSRRQQQSSWAGVLVDKKSEYDEDSGKSTYTLVFNTDHGQKKVRVRQQSDLNAWNLGDKAAKASGELFPHKVG